MLDAAWWALTRTWADERPLTPDAYARIDGGFSIWDPARNYWRESEHAPVVSTTRPSAFQFNRKQTWWGLWRSAKLPRRYQ